MTTYSIIKVRIYYHLPFQPTPTSPQQNKENNNKEIYSPYSTVSNTDDAAVMNNQLKNRINNHPQNGCNVKRSRKNFPGRIKLTSSTVFAFHQSLQNSRSPKRRSSASIFSLNQSAAYQYGQSNAILELSSLFHGKAPQTKTMLVILHLRTTNQQHQLFSYFCLSRPSSNNMQRGLNNSHMHISREPLCLDHVVWSCSFSKYQIFRSYKRLPPLLEPY